jgi:hypothetical protein
MHENANILIKIYTSLEKKKEKEPRHKRFGKQKKPDDNFRIVAS